MGKLPASTPLKPDAGLIVSVDHSQDVTPMDFDFDTPLALRGTHCSKYDGIEKMFGTDSPDMIPMWVADMDFATSPAIRAALSAEVERGYMGYYANLAPAQTALIDWAAARQGWEIAPEAIRFNTGVMAGYADAIEAFSNPGDGVIIFTPVYHEFRMKISALKRRVVSSELEMIDGQHVMNLDALAASLKGDEKVLTLCTPHNPGGRIWSAEEIREVADFCVAHDLLLIADEIHMDLIHPGGKGVPTAVAAPDISDRLVVITAASKTFNIAGLKTGIMVIPDAGVRGKIDALTKARASSPNRLGMAALKAAYSASSDWQEELMKYLAGNFAIWRDRIGALPGVRVTDMQATYLTWVDFTGTGLSEKDLMRRFLHDARVAPNPGSQFGENGEAHMRCNIALPRPTLLKAIERIEAAFADIQ